MKLGDVILGIVRDTALFNGRHPYLSSLVETRRMYSIYVPRARAINRYAYA